MFFAGVTTHRAEQPGAPLDWQQLPVATTAPGAMPILTEMLKGFLILLIFTSLLTLPLGYWVPADVALSYCLQSIVAMGWLWIALAPLVTLLVWITERYFTIKGQHRH